MPVIKSAKKKLRHDRKVEKVNDSLRKGLKEALKEAQKQKSSEKIRNAVKTVDKAVKKGLIHKNKAARIKSKLSKLVKLKTSKNVEKSKPRKTKK